MEAQALLGAALQLPNRAPHCDLCTFRLPGPLTGAQQVSQVLHRLSGLTNLGCQGLESRLQGDRC